MTAESTARLLYFLFAWLTFYVAVAVRDELVMVVRETLLAIGRGMREALRVKPDPLALSRRDRSGAWVELEH